jgi:hypothetical protein
LTFELERQAIEERFNTNHTSTPIQYENVKFEQPDEASWVALTLLPGNANQVSVGTTRHVKRFSGIIQVDIFTVEDTGTKIARDLADSISAIFDSVQFSLGSSGLITTRVPEYTTLGVENGWYHAVVSVAYHRDKIG